MNTRSPHRSEEIIAIASEWMHYAHQHYMDTHAVWYLYNFACGWSLRDSELQTMKNWISGLDHEKEKVKTVDDYVRRMLS